MDSVRVLAYGGIGERPCDAFRLGMYTDLLAARSVFVEPWSQIGIERPAGYEGSPLEALAEGVGEVDLSPLDRSDVLLLRRWQHTTMTCPACGRPASSISELGAHAASTGHIFLSPDPVIHHIVEALERRPTRFGHLAVVYETDDYLFDQPEWVGFGASLRAERDMIERMLRLADLVTVTTPRLKTLLSRFNLSVRIIRNAIDPDWYRAEPSDAGARSADTTTILFYGAAARRNDYAICQEAVDQATRESVGVRRVWLGAGTDRAAAATVDLALPYEHDLQAFARRLAGLRPDVGLAPVGRDEFAAAKSELHWLEYTMAGAATVASRTYGDGPYSVIRDGVDGLLARSKQDWREQMRRAVGSRDFREQLAGRARERVLAEYQVRDRALEWEDVFRWAANHPGSAAGAA